MAGAGRIGTWSRGTNKFSTYRTYRTVGIKKVCFANKLVFIEFMDSTERFISTISLNPHLQK